METTKTVKNTVAIAPDGKTYEVYTMDYQHNRWSGYLAFPGYCEPNPCRTFPISESRIEELRK